MVKIDVIVVGGNTLDSLPTLIFRVDSACYLVNIPDQTQRLLLLNKFSLSKIKEIILTGYTHEHMGGFWGLVLTTVGINPYSTGVVAPPEFKEALCANPMYTRFPDYAPPISQEYADESISFKIIRIESSFGVEVKLVDEPPHFIPAAAKKAGVKPGPNFKKLSAGEDVTLEDGTIVYSKDCMTTITPGDKILLLDIRHEEDFKLIPDLKQYSDVIHLGMLNSDIVKDGETKHYCFPFDGSAPLERSNEFYEKHRAVCKLLKPLASEKSEAAPKPFIGLKGGDQLVFQPMDKKGVKQFFKNKSLPLYEAKLPEFNEFAITFTGTRAKVPSQASNTAGILVHTKHGYIIMDAGESTYGQISRLFGRKNTNYIMRNLKAIVVSHEHADHIIGLDQILRERSIVSDERIPIVADSFTLGFVRQRSSTLGDDYYKCDPILHQDIEVAGIKIKSIPVKHCENSHGFLLEIDGKRLAYSGDRCKADGFLEAVRSCDLLIHDATFKDWPEEACISTGHSSIAGAVAAGKALGAKTVLTHLSKRYACEETEVTEDGVIFGFDFLTFALEEFDELCPIFKKMITIDA